MLKCPTMSWFAKLLPSKVRIEAAKKKGVPEGIWTRCPSCGSILYQAELMRNLDVCPKCDYHMRISARKRLETFLDPQGREELAADTKTTIDNKLIQEVIASCETAAGKHNFKLPEVEEL